MRAEALGVFGGTFDPPHYGHLRTAFELLQELQLAEVRFLPCHLPPHRDPPVADAALRLAMLRAALDASPGMQVDPRELQRSGPSYSVDTLTSLRADFPARPLCLILGMDAFLGLPKWHRWSAILELAHIVVAHRPGWCAPVHGVLGELIAERATASPQDLHAAPAGRVHVQAVTALEISSSRVRALVRAGRDPRFLMPDRVRKLVLDSGCYAATEVNEEYE